MPSADSYNLTMAKAKGLIFSLFDVASAREVLLPYRCTYNASFMDLPVPSFVYYSSLLIAKKCQFAVGTWCIMEIVCNFLLWLQKFFLTIGNKVSSFQTIIDITGVHGAIGLMWCACMGSPVRWHLQGTLNVILTLRRGGFSPWCYKILLQ